MKTILLYTGIFIVGFVVLFAGTYLLFPYLKPKEAAEVHHFIENKGLPPIYDYTKYSPLKMDSLTAEVSELKKKIKHYKSAPHRNKLLVDSLVNVGKQQKHIIEQLRDSLDLKNKLIADQKKKTIQKKAGLQFSDVGKSLLSMDPGTLAPILKKLNDNMLVGLYKDGSNMQREKLLQSLDPSRAAELLKKVTQ